MTIGDKIRRYRRMMDLTQEELGRMMNPPVNRAAVNKWETGIVENIKRSQIEQLCRIFKVSATDLMCFDNEVGVPEDVLQIPLLGRVAAGSPITAMENRIGTVGVSRDSAGGSDLFALKISGDSMSPRIYDGDVVIVKAQPDAENGQIVVALINGDDAVCKKLIKYEDGIALASLNPAYTPMYFSQSDIENYPVRILGVVVELRSKL